MGEGDCRDEAPGARRRTTCRRDTGRAASVCQLQQVLFLLPATCCHPPSLAPPLMCYAGPQPAVLPAQDRPARVEAPHLVRVHSLTHDMATTFAVRKAAIAQLRGDIDHGHDGLQGICTSHSSPPITIVQSNCELELMRRQKTAEPNYSITRSSRSWAHTLQLVVSELDRGFECERSCRSRWRLDL